MAIEVIMEIEDKSGDKSTTSCRVQDGLPIAALDAFAVGWANVVDNIINGVIRKVTAYLKPSLASIPTNTIGADADVENVGRFSFRSTSGVDIECNLPCLNEVAVGAYTSDSLNQANPSVAAFISMFEDGLAVTGGTIVPSDNGGFAVADLNFAREAFRNSGSRR